MLSDFHFSFRRPELSETLISYVGQMYEAYLNVQKAYLDQVEQFRDTRISVDIKDSLDFKDLS